MNGPLRGGLRELASLLASPNPVDHLVGLGRLRALGGASQIPVLLHVLRTCDTAVRHALLERITGFGTGAVGLALEQMLDSDAPHPQSAIEYLGRARDAAYNRLLLKWLARLDEGLQLESLRILARTGSGEDYEALESAARGLKGEPLVQAGRVLRLIEARRSLRAKAVSVRPAVRPRAPAGRDPAMFGPRARVVRPVSWNVPPSVVWIPPDLGDALAILASAVVLAPALWKGVGPRNPLEFCALLIFLLAMSRCLLGWPRVSRNWGHPTDPAH